MHHCWCIFKQNEEYVFASGLGYGMVVVIWPG
jgi:hypothetical protein